MPKEIIDDYVNGEFSLDIRWQRDDGFIQVGTFNPNREYRMSYAEGEQGEVFTASGLYSTLGRDHINRLIKVLRRARDQACGADE